MTAIEPINDARNPLCKSQIILCARYRKRVVISILRALEEVRVASQPSGKCVAPSTGRVCQHPMRSRTYQLSNTIVAGHARQRCALRTHACATLGSPQHANRAPEAGRNDPMQHHRTVHQFKAENSRQSASDCGLHDFGRGFEPFGRAECPSVRPGWPCRSCIRPSRVSTPKPT